MTKKSRRRAFTVELDQKTDEYDWNNKNNYYIFVQVQRLMFVSVNILVMFNVFGHIHSVILNQSSDYSSPGAFLNIYHVDMKTLNRQI